MKTATPQTSITANTITSDDGAHIRYLTLGQGPGVLVIPGALSDAMTYVPFARALADDFTIHIIQRRGRPGSSPQGPDYSIAKEIADAHAVLQATGATLLVGHSYGGLVALETARNHPDLTKVAVYEPGVSIDGSISIAWMAAFEKHLVAQRPLDAFVSFVLGTGPDRFHNTPPWLMKIVMPLVVPAEERRERLAYLPECLREHRELSSLDNSYAHYHEITADVLLMYGVKTRSRWVDLAMERLATVLRHAQTLSFPKLDHFGIDKRAPGEVAEAVKAFFHQA